MNLDSDRIAVDLKSLKEGESYDLDFSLTEKEKNYFPNLIDLSETSFVLDVHSIGVISSLTLTGDGKALLRDAHDGEECVYPFSDEVDLTIQPSDPENSDLLPDEDGLYDFRGAILAMLFNLIPQNYSQVPLTRIEHENYVLMSEEEYEKEKKKKNGNAFSALDDVD